MTDASSRADVLFMEAELRRLMMPVESLEDLCLRSVHTFLPRRNDAAPVIAALLKDRLIKRIPTSLVRVGDGEGNVLALTREAVHPVYLDSFNAKLFGQVGMTLPEDEARMLCSKIRHALCAASSLVSAHLMRQDPSSKQFPMPWQTGKSGRPLACSTRRRSCKTNLRAGTSVISS
jgi:hypothetical protein